MIIDIKAEMAKFRAEIPRPPRDRHGKAWHGATQDAVNRHQGIKRQILRGKTFEDAKAYYDAPKGVCIGCGDVAWTKSGKQCKACHRAVAREVQARLRKRKGGSYERRLNCSVCGTEFVALNGGRKNCDVHMRRRGEPQRYVPRKPKPSAMPPTWEKKSEKPVQPIAAPRPVDVSGLQVTRVPSFVPAGLRNLLPEPGERFYTAAD